MTRDSFNRQSLGTMLNTSVKQVRKPSASFAIRLPLRCCTLRASEIRFPDSIRECEISVWLMMDLAQMTLCLETDHFS